MKVGITGQAGFVGTHLFNTLKLHPETFECVPFEDAFFDDPARLLDFVKSCDVVVHLAAVNRCGEYGTWRYLVITEPPKLMLELDQLTGGTPEAKELVLG